ncbi:DUF488 family protein, N3 subclade, partial [Bordetella pertussis]
MKPAIHLKRAYEAAAPADGRRVLIDGLWPRGLRKDALPPLAGVSRTLSGRAARPVASGAAARPAGAGRG